MDSYSKRHFNYRKAEIFSYGKLFIKSEGGGNWEKIWKGSTKSLTEPFWLSFYYDLETRKFQDLIEQLFSYNIGVYQRSKLLEETKDIIKRINEIEPIIVDTPSTRPQVSIDPEILEKNKTKIEFLFDNDVVCNYPWGPHEKNDIIQFKSAVFEEFKDLLFDGYYSVIHHYENEDQKQIQKLEIQIQNLNNAIQSQNDENRNKLALLRNKTSSIEVSVKQLKDENQKLASANQKLDKDENIDEEETPDSVAFLLTFLYRMGILDTRIWPTEKTAKQVATLLKDLLTLKGSDKINVDSFKREINKINNREQRGLSIIENNDIEVKRLITKRFPKFDFTQQEFLLKFNNKQNKDMS